MCVWCVCVRVLRACMCVCVCVCVCQPHLEYFFGVFGRLVQDDELVSAEKTSFTEALLILRYSTYVIGSAKRGTSSKFSFLNKYNF